MRNAAEFQPHFRGPSRLSRVAPAEDHVFHALATQALGALLAQHPGERVNDVALAASVRTDDRRHAVIERELGSIWKTLEAGDLQTLKPHAVIPSRGSNKTKAAPRVRLTSLDP